MMKQLLKSTAYVVCLAFVGTYLNAQVNTHGNTQNTITGENAFIDVSEFTDDTSLGKGLSFPQTDLTKWDFVTSKMDGLDLPTFYDGLVVYNTGNGQTKSGQGVQVSVSPGFYYFHNPNGSLTNKIGSGYWVPLGKDGDAWNVNGEDRATNIARTGNVAIGTNAAQSTKLHVADANYNVATFQDTRTTGLRGPHLVLKSNTGEGVIDFMSDGTVNGGVRDHAFEYRAPSDGRHNFSTGDIDNPDMTITKDGRVGIGTTAPQQKLHVSGGARVTSMATGSVSGTTPDNIVTVNSNGDLRKVSPTALKNGINTDNQQVTKFSFNTTSSILSLTLDANTQKDVDLSTLKSTSTADGDAWGVSGENTTVSIARTGNVAIGTTATKTQKLHVEGGATITSLPTGTVYGGSSSDEFVTANSSGTLRTVNASTAVRNLETNTSIGQANDGNIVHTNEDGNKTSARLISGNSGNLAKVGTDKGVFVDPAMVPQIRLVRHLGSNAQSETFETTSQVGFNHIAYTILGRMAKNCGGGTNPTQPAEFRIEVLGGRMFFTWLRQGYGAIISPSSIANLDNEIELGISGCSSSSVVDNFKIKIEDSGRRVVVSNTAGKHSAFYYDLTWFF